MRREGQIKQRGEGRFLVSVFLGRDESGKRIYRSKTVRGSRRQAERELRKQLAEKDAGTLPATRRLTLNAYLDEWLDAKQESLKPRTFEQYRYILEKHVRPELGMRPLDRLTPLAVQAFYRRMRERGRTARTVAHVHRVLRNALRQARRLRLIPTDPTEAVEVPSAGRPRHRALTLAEVRRFREACAASPYGALYVLMVATGLRPGEACGLRWQDVDLDAGLVRVVQSVSWLMKPNAEGRRWTFITPKTDRSRRTIPIPPELARDLARHRAAQGKRRLKAGGTAWEDHDLVFCGQRGQPLDWHNLSARHFRPIREAAGLPAEVRPYDLRHTCASLLAAQGETPNVVADRLGHSRPTLTLDVYTHAFPGQQERATEKLGAILYGGVA